MLLGAARMAMEDSNKQRPGWFYSDLIAITFSALSIEALCNAFGNRFVPDWKDFESSSPIAKLRIICTHLEVNANFDIEPWSKAVWLIKFRNKIAHPKPEFVKENEVWSRDEYDDLRQQEPKSKIERQITNGNANKAYKTAVAIKEALCDAVPIEEQFGLRNDSWHGSSRVADDN